MIKAALFGAFKAARLEMRVVWGERPPLPPPGGGPEPAPTGVALYHLIRGSD
jgi:hypothetical protein